MHVKKWQKKENFFLEMLIPCLLQMRCLDLKVFHSSSWVINPTHCSWKPSKFTSRLCRQIYLKSHSGLMKLDKTPADLKKKECQRKFLPVLSVPVISLNRYCANLKISRLQRFLQLIFAPRGRGMFGGVCTIPKLSRSVKRRDNIQGKT